MKILTSLICFLLLSVSCFAQDYPAYMTEAEKKIYPDYLLRVKQTTSPGLITQPPNSPVRTAAEWEELQGVLVTYTAFTSMIRDIVKEARKECKVYVVCSNASATANDLLFSNIDTSNIEFLVTPYNSVWSRDYGPWSAYTNDVDSLITVDWIYNRPRPSDDQIPLAISNSIGTPFYETSVAPWDLVHTGGNFMTDGLGTGFSSKLILNENSSKTEAEIDTIMKEFMGIERYIKMDNLPFDVIHHIDMHMKLLDEETILMGEYPTGVADGPQIEANLQYVLANFNSVFGSPYKVVRIPMPPDQTNRYPGGGGDYWTHTNASFVNKTILVPVYNGPSDTTALRIFREAMPGYNVVGINSRPSIPSLGAIHCIMKEIASSDPLLIVHQSLQDTYDDVNPYNVSASIKHRSGIFSADLYYRIDTVQPYSVVSMSNSGASNWTGSIPAQNIGSKVDYYIEAEANSGKTQVRPLVAPDGYFDFNVRVLTAVEENENSGMVEIQNVFPNPASAMTCIPMYFGMNDDFRLNLYDITGRHIKEIYNGVLKEGHHKFFLDASTLSSGVYTITYEGSTFTESTKLIVR